MSFLATLTKSRSAASDRRSAASERTAERDATRADRDKVFRARNAQLSEDYNLFLTDNFLGPLGPLLHDTPAFLTGLDALVNQANTFISEFETDERARAAEATARGDRYRAANTPVKVNLLKDKGFPALVIALALDSPYVTLDVFHKPGASNRDKTIHAPAHLTHWSGVERDEDGLPAAIIPSSFVEFTDERGNLRKRPDNPTLPKITLIHGNRIDRPDDAPADWQPSDAQRDIARRAFAKDGGIAALDHTHTKSFISQALALAQRIREHLSALPGGEIVAREPSTHDDAHTSFFWTADVAWTGLPSDHRDGGSELRLVLHAPHYNTLMRSQAERRAERAAHFRKQQRRSKLSTRK